MMVTMLKSKWRSAQNLIDSLYDYLGEQPLLNKMLRTHHVDIHQRLDKLEENVAALKPKPQPLTTWQQQVYKQICDAQPLVKRALKTTTATEQDPKPELVKDYLFFLLWLQLEKIEFTEQGVKNFEEYLSQTATLQDNLARKQEKDRGQS